MESNDDFMADLEKRKTAAMPFITFCIGLITGLESVTKERLHATREDGQRKYKRPNIPAMRKLFDDGLTVPDAVNAYAANYLNREPGDVVDDYSKEQLLEDLGRAADISTDFLATCTARSEYGPLFDVMFPLWLRRFMNTIQEKSPVVKLNDDNYGMAHKEVLQLFLDHIPCDVAAIQYIDNHPLPTEQFNPNEARHVH